jgi:hypothetical protein
MTAVADLARSQTQTLDRGAQSTEVVLARVTRIQEIKQRVMKRGVHFGAPFPGSDKDTLLKPGGELLLMTFQIGAIPEIEDLSTPDAARYRVRQRAVHQVTGEVLGEYTAEASSDEDKKRWRAAVCDQEWDEAPIDQRRKLWKKKRDGDAYTVLQIRTSPADEANDVLAVAQKRAMIGLTRQVLACSDLFDQNLEDMPDYLREQAVDGQTGKPQRASAAASTNGSGDTSKASANGQADGEKPKSGITEAVLITGYKEREIKKKAGGTLKKFEVTVGNIVYETINERLATSAKEAHEKKAWVRLHWTLNEPYGRKLEKLEAAEAPKPAAAKPDPKAEAAPAPVTTREREPGDEDDVDLTPDASSLNFGK